MHSKIYDFIGIGIGPFNLGLASLAKPVKNLNALFFDKAPEFNWHPGMMLDTATLQVPFMADLVTMADPCSPFSFLNYLKQNNRIYKFYIREDFFLLRKEYNLYCRWVVSLLPECLFNHLVHTISYQQEQKHYVVQYKNLVNDEEHIIKTKRVVLGTGTKPYVPPFAESKQLASVYHTSRYLKIKKQLLQQKSITLIGSGQSAAEVFYDLLQEIDYAGGQQLNWFTRADRMAPLEYSSLTLELTSPEYVDHFYALPPDKKNTILSAQNYLYKGINMDLIKQIYDFLYQKSLDYPKLPVNIHTCSALTAISETTSGTMQLRFHHTQQNLGFDFETNAVVLATGYKYQLPECLYGIKERIKWDDEGRLDVNRNYSVDVNASEVFVQNAELHTHGFVTPDLGMGAYRNAIILNEIAGREVYKTEKQIAFQQFSAPQKMTNPSISKSW